MSEKLGKFDAKVISIDKRCDKNGDAAVQVVCKHDDGSEWGKKIYDWFYFDSEKTEKCFLRWGSLSRKGCSLLEAKEILVGANFSLIGLEVTLGVNTSDDFWRVNDVYLKGKEPKAEASPDDDGIPF